MEQKTLTKPNHIKTAYDAGTTCLRLYTLTQGIGAFIICTLVTAAVTIVLQHFKVI